ncbi:MAG TPA: aminotransferase class IV family protein [Sulfuricurvum sp.]|nr:aminotransferase class IV family protein [Sulfuricurvum sp.]
MKPNTLLETIRCEGGIAHHLTYHQGRLDNSLSSLGIAARYTLSDLITPPDDALYRCRFLYDEEHYRVEYHPYSPKKITSLRLIHDDTIDYSLKYADRNVLEKLFDARDGCDDILIVKNGYLTDTTIANIALFIDNQWLTPDSPLLEGTTRSRLIDEGKIIPARLHVSDARNASSIALINAMTGFVEIENAIIL